MRRNTSLVVKPPQNYELWGGSLEYSIENSGSKFASCLPSLGYGAKSVSEIVGAMRITHERFPKLAWLNVQVKKAGLLETAKTIKPNSGKGSVYLHFLAIERLLVIGFYDYFCMNPTTIAKLNRWFAPLKEVKGIIEFDKELCKIATKAENRKVNLERQRKLAHRVGVYLVIRYQLDNLRSLSPEQWQEFVSDCREHSRTTESGYRVSMASLMLMHSTFFNMGVLDKHYNRNEAYVKSIVKTRQFLQDPDFGAFAAPFISNAKTTKVKATVGHYRTTLELFYQYLVGRHGKGFRIAMLTRADVVEFINVLSVKKKDEGFSYNWLEARCLCTKLFLRYISENAKAFEREGHQVFKKKVVIDADFRTPIVTQLPKPLEKETIEALCKTLQYVPSARYRLCFLLMLTTGLAKGDATILKLNCMTHVEKTDTYSLSVWRKKVKKEGNLKLNSQVPPIIKKLQDMNTQLVPSPHPDGSYAIYLFNDAGKPVGAQWLDYWLKIHKTLAAEAHPDLASVINVMVSHQLRHTFACMLREGGANILQIQELMLHENINTTAKYTRESDKVKVVMVKRLIEGQYICDEFPMIDQKFLKSEEGLTFIAHIVRFENRFTYGRCTINGTENCKQAYRCLTCTYLCSTKDDLPEILSSIMIQHLQYKELTTRLLSETNEERVKSLTFEQERMKARLKVLAGKAIKLQAIIEAPIAEPTVLDGCDDVLTFY